MSDRRTLRVLIAEDEPHARRKLRDLLQEQPDVEIVAEAANGEEAVEMLGASQADVAFLDIEMPGLGGFEVIETIGPARMPWIVFATAFHKYAIDAFEVEAVDYLLKPFDAARLAETLERVRNRLAGGVASRGPDELAELLRRMLDAQRRSRRFLDRIAVTRGERTLLIDVGDIRYIAAQGNRVVIATAEQTFALPGSLKSLAAKLEPERFLRIHRSVVVNRDHIAEVQPWYRGESFVVLDNGRGFSTGAAFRDNLLRQLSNEPGAG